MSNKRVQTVLTYAELNELLGQTERGPIEAIAADPVQRRVKIIFGASGCPDGIEPWVFKIDRPLSPPSAYTSEGSPEPTSGGGEPTKHWKSGAVETSRMRRKAASSSLRTVSEENMGQTSMRDGMPARS